MDPSTNEVMVSLGFTLSEILVCCLCTDASRLREAWTRSGDSKLISINRSGRAFGLPKAERTRNECRGIDQKYGSATQGVLANRQSRLEQARAGPKERDSSCGRPHARSGDLEEQGFWGASEFPRAECRPARCEAGVCGWPTGSPEFAEGIGIVGDPGRDFAFRAERPSTRDHRVPGLRRKVHCSGHRRLSDYKDAASGVMR